MNISPSPLCVAVVALKCFKAFIVLSDLSVQREIEKFYAQKQAQKLHCNKYSKKELINRKSKYITFDKAFVQYAYTKQPKSYIPATIYFLKISYGEVTHSGVIKT